MEIVLAPRTEPRPAQLRTTTDARPTSEERTLTENDRTPIVAPLVVAGVGILLTLALALSGTVAPGNALRFALVGGVVAVMVAMATTCVLHRLRVASLDAELAQARDRVGEAGSRAATLADSRRDLVVWVSDDLRTPLARLQATAEALEDGVIAQPVEVAAALVAMNEEIDRLGELVTDLCELSHLGEGSRAAATGPVSVVPGAPLVAPTGSDLASRTFDIAFRAGDPATTLATGSPAIDRAVAAPR